MLSNRQKALLVVSLTLFGGCATVPDVLPFGSAKNASVVGRQLSLARLSERHGQQGAAERIYQQVLAEDSDNAQALHRMGVIAAREDRLDDAMDLFNRAKLADPNNAALMADLGYAYYLKDELDQAEVELRASLEIDSQLGAAHNNLGLVLAQKGKWDESLREFRLAVEDGEAYANLAFMQSQMGELKLAEQNFHKALDLDPSLRNAAEGLVQLDRTIDVHDARMLARKNQETDSPTVEVITPDVIQVSGMAENLPVPLANTIPTQIESSVPVVSPKPAPIASPATAPQAMPTTAPQAMPAVSQTPAPVESQYHAPVVTHNAAPVSTTVATQEPAPVFTDMSGQSTNYPSTALPQAEYFDSELVAEAQPIGEQVQPVDDTRLLTPTRVAMPGAAMPQVSRESNSSLAPMPMSVQQRGPTVKMSPPMLGGGSSRANRPGSESEAQPSQNVEASSQTDSTDEAASISFSG